MMQQQIYSDNVSLEPCEPTPIETIWLWLEEEDKEESKRIGELKERQKQKQKAFEEQVRKRQEHAPRPPSPPGFAEDETTT
jgi:hypothetical protein